MCIRVRDDFVRVSACCTVMSQYIHKYTVHWRGSVVHNIQLGFYEQQAPASRMLALFSCCSRGVRWRSLLRRDADAVIVGRQQHLKTDVG